MKAGAPLQNISAQAGSASPGSSAAPLLLFWFFSSRDHLFLQCLKPRCGVDSGSLINELDRSTWNARHARDVAKGRDVEGGVRQAEALGSSLGFSSRRANETNGARFRCFKPGGLGASLALHCPVQVCKDWLWCGRCSGGFCKVSAPGEERTNFFFFFLNLVNYPQGGLSRPALEMWVRSWRWFTLSRCKFMVGSVPPTFGPSFDLFHSLECAGIFIFHREIRLHRFYGNIC